MKRRRVGVSAGIAVAAVILLAGFFGTRNTDEPEYDPLPSYESPIAPSLSAGSDSAEAEDIPPDVQFMTVPNTTTADLVPRLPEQLLPEYKDAAFTTETFGGAQKRGGRRVIAGNETDAVIAYAYNDGENVQLIYLYCAKEDLEQALEDLKIFLQTY
ncbi:MAG: hypothetical protein LBD85_00210 [Oscillospiraceae bacterium]|jgi:hypothetical protein|nr:hypothetical protein [Oscillospiraceae bacterium]